MKVRLFIGNIPEKCPVSISIRWVPGGKWWDPRKEHREWETHTLPRLKIIREIASEVFRLMAFRIPEWQSFRRFVNISSHVIACHTGVHSASWSCLGSGSSYSSGLLQVSHCIWDCQGLHQVSCGCIRSCFTLQLLLSFLWSASEAGAGPAVLHLLDQLEYFKQRTVKPFVQFSGKTFSSIPWLGFSSVKGRVILDHLAVLIKDLKLVATIWTLGKSFWPFVWGFSGIAAIWRAIVWINDAAFGIYTEENILLTESGRLKRLLIRWQFGFKNSVVFASNRCLKIRTGASRVHPVRSWVRKQFASSV